MSSRASANRNTVSAEETTLGFPVSGRLVLFVGIPALTLLLGIVLPVIARWALNEWTSLPVRPVFRFIGAVDQPWEVVVNLAIWLAVGFGIAVTAMVESLKVTLTDAEMRVKDDHQNRTIPRSDVAAVFMDGKRLVVLDRASRQLVRDIHEESPEKLAAAFRAHGYPWMDADPYADLYHLWTAETPDLPPPANAVLAARETALKKKAKKETQDLRAAVEKIGYVVRDEDARQFWRPLVRS